MDNLNVSLAVEKLRSHSSSSAVLSKIFLASIRWSLELSCTWVPREHNQVADLLSKGKREAALHLLGDPPFRALPAPPGLHGMSRNAIRIAQAFADARGSPFSPGVLRTRLR